MRERHFVERKHESSMAASKVSLKLLVDTNGKKVLFAEAGKDFIDFLFNIMSMPVGTVTRLLTKNSMVGSLGNLYDSIETLGDTYLQTTEIRENLLKPQMPSSALNVPVLLPSYCGNNADSSTAAAKLLYQCQHGYNRSACTPNVSDDALAVCPNCNERMTRQMSYIVPPPNKVQPATPVSGDAGFVKGVVTYMVMDNLVVSPMSTISCITLLNKFGIKGIDTLEERVVELGIEEGLELLKESLQSKAVLTSVFIKDVSVEYNTPEARTDLVSDLK